MLFVLYSKADTITWPKLSWTDVLGNSICLLHSGDNPVTSIKMYQCPGNEIWDMTDNNFAWITSQKQMYSSTNGATTANSQIYFKDTKYYCRNAGHFTTGLNPGQPCSGDKDWNGRSCNGDSGLWFGRTSGMSWNSHTDWDVKLAWIAATTYPYLSTWQSWKTSGSCNDDYDCDPKYFWWYASSTAKSSSTKTCLEKFSQSDSTTFGWADINSNALDGMINGKYCKSGYAVKSATDTAKCVTITSVVTDLGTQASPYKWTATNTANTWKYYYDSTNYASSYCECGLDGSTGYCPMPGSTELTKYVIIKL